MKKLFSSLSPPEVSWSISYVIIAWLGELGNGAIQTITGPMQPFLAYNLQTDTQTINLVWTLGFMGFLLGSLITSHIFTKFLVTSVRKLIFLSLVMLLTGLATLALPFMNKMPLLLLARFVQFLSYGLFLTADSILLVFTLGPEKSRPFINALHFFISCGFLLGTFLVQPFLPSMRDKVCSERETENSTAILEKEEMLIPNLYGIQSICWPFILSGVWCILISVCFLCLSMKKSWVMPQFYDENTNTKHKDSGPIKLTPAGKRIFLSLVILFFSLSGGVVRVFQSMSTTFGMCGPLQLEPTQAALTDTFYSTGMCFGRLTSTFLSPLILPHNLLIICMVGCLISSLLLMFLAPIYYVSLYCGVAIMGFFVSWQFATGFSWTSHHMNITGKLSSVFFIGNSITDIRLSYSESGLGIGSLSSPPLAGWVFMISPLNVLYTVGVMISLQCLAVLLMWVVSRRTLTSSSDKQHKQLITDN